MRCGRGGEERLAERGCDSKGFWPEELEGETVIN